MTYPEWHMGAPLDTGRGRQIPTTSVGHHRAERARWFGVSDGNLDTVFPNIANFYDPYSLEPPTGILHTPTEA